MDDWKKLKSKNTKELTSGTKNAKNPTFSILHIFDLLILIFFWGISSLQLGCIQMMARKIKIQKY